MEKNVEDIEGARSKLKKFLNIKNDLSEKSNELNGKNIYNAIQTFSQEWFTIDNISELLGHMRSCKINVPANTMRLILEFFKNQNKDLYFNSVSKRILAQIDLVYDSSCYNNNELVPFKNLLALIINNVDEKQSNDLNWSDVLSKVSLSRYCDMADLLSIWNNSKSTNKEEVNITNTLDKIKANQIFAKDMVTLLSTLTKEQKPQLANREVVNRILDKEKMPILQPAQDTMLAEQLKGYLAEDDTDIILNRTSPDNAGEMYKLITQLTLKNKHCEMILKKLRESKAPDLLILVGELVEIGFVFDKDHYQNVLTYLDSHQTVDDVCNLLQRFNDIGVKLTNELVGSIINKLAPDQTVDGVCNLLQKFNDIGVKPTNELVGNIINKLASNQTVDDVYNLLHKFKILNMPLKQVSAINIVNKLKPDLALDNVCGLLKEFQVFNLSLYSNNWDDDVVYAILKNFKSHQSANDLLNLVISLQQFNIKLKSWNYSCIVKMLAENQNADDVADLLITLGNIIGFDKGNDILPGIDDILSKIQDNQSEDSIIKLAKVLIAMGKNLALYPGHFRKKLEDYEENQDLETLLKLNPNRNKLEYTQEQQKFVKEFTRGKEESEKNKENKKSEKKLISKFKTGNDIIEVKGEKKRTTIDNGIFKINSEDGNINQHDNFNQSGYIIEKKINQTIGSSNNKLALQIIGVALVILGILCIILSLTIASEVLLSLLILGCILFTAGISILVRLFCKHKNDKSTNLFSGYKTPTLTNENERNNEINSPLLSTDGKDLPGQTYVTHDNF